MCVHVGGWKRGNKKWKGEGNKKYDEWEIN
jgi:hypothetical protein